METEDAIEDILLNEILPNGEKIDDMHDYQLLEIIEQEEKFKNQEGVWGKIGERLVDHAKSAYTKATDSALENIPLYRVMETANSIFRDVRFKHPKMEIMDLRKDNDSDWMKITIHFSWPFKGCKKGGYYQYKMHIGSQECGCNFQSMSDDSSGEVKSFYFCHQRTRERCIARQMYSALVKKQVGVELSGFLDDIFGEKSWSLASPKGYEDQFLYIVPNNSEVLSNKEIQKIEVKNGK